MAQTIRRLCGDKAGGYGRQAKSNGCVRMTVSNSALVKAPLRRFAKDRGGATTVAFAIAVPLFTAVVIGVVQGSLLLFDEIELANAAVAGSRAFAIARQPSCHGCSARPYTDTISAITNSGSLRPGAVEVTLQVGGAACSSDAACLAALNAAHTSRPHYSSASQTAVTVTYPCPKLLPSSWMTRAGLCADNRYSGKSGYLSVRTSQQVQ
jgi:Flp pilus assembly protein TadG